MAERISCQVRRTETNRVMIVHFAFGIDATNIVTRIDTLQVTARLVFRTVAIDDAFGFAFRERISLISRNARAYCFIALYPAVRSTSARARLTRVLLRNDGVTSGIRISERAFLAITDGSVLFHFAFRSDAART